MEGAGPTRYGLFPSDVIVCQTPLYRQTLRTFLSSLNSAVEQYTRKGIPREFLACVSAMYTTLELGFCCTICSGLRYIFELLAVLIRKLSLMSPPLKQVYTRRVYFEVEAWLVLLLSDWGLLDLVEKTCCMSKQ